MPDLKTTLDQGVDRFEPSPDALARTLRIVARRRRNRRLAAASVALALTAFLIGGGALLRSEPQPQPATYKPTPSVMPPTTVVRWFERHSRSFASHARIYSGHVGNALPVQPGRYVRVGRCQSGNPSTCGPSFGAAITLHKDGRYAFTHGDATAVGRYVVPADGSLEWSSGPLPRSKGWLWSHAQLGRRPFLVQYFPHPYAVYFIWVHT